MYLSYSGYQCASGCLYHYWHKYIGKTEPPKPDDRLGSIYGTVVGRLFETFYKDELWRTPGSSGALSALVGDLVDTVLAEEQQPRKGRYGGVIVWREDLYARREDLVADVLAAVPRGLATIRTHRLIGKDVEAELKLDSEIDGHTVAGRADFVMTRVAPHGDLVIVDGKGSRRRGKYVDEQQLRWYAMLYREKHGRLPDRTAFVYWHFDPPSNLDWCTCTQEDVDALKTKIITFIRTLETASTKVGSSKSLPLVRSVFTPSPDISNCRFCPYAAEEVCPQGFEVVLKWTQRTKKQNGKH